MPNRHAVLLTLLVLGAGCSAGRTRTTGPSDGGMKGHDGGTSDMSACASRCSTDGRSVVTCDGTLVTTCSATQACDPSSVTCLDACGVAVQNKSSVGCDYYAVEMDSFGGPADCFAAFVANTQQTPVKLQVERDGVSLSMAAFTRIPQGSGTSLTYLPYDPTVGVPPGQVAILFLGGDQGDIPLCPAPSAAAESAMVMGTGLGHAFHITSDLPVVAYQISPFGGGQVAVTGASLLLPTSVWDTGYVGVNAGAASSGMPSMDIVAMEDSTTVDITPVAGIEGGNGVPAALAGSQFSLTLDKGAYVQLSQMAELSGSIISANKPVGLLGGHTCLQVPLGVAYCDHAEQMIPPLHALGSEYVGVMYRPRKGEPALWRIIGAVAGTQLSYSSAVGGPTTLDVGQVVDFPTGTPFVVKSQDKDHPFLLFELMSGSMWSMLSDQSGYGDADFVISVPPLQYERSYLFFTDPTYPETNIVLVRAKESGVFKDVTLDCAGVLSGWQQVAGSQDYEWTRADLSTGNFQNVGTCSNGRHEIHSDGPFGLWVWGWGTPLTDPSTENVSYGYPGGMNIQSINDVPIL